jgi:hypothetical protein
MQSPPTSPVSRLTSRLLDASLNGPAESENEDVCVTPKRAPSGQWTRVKYPMDDSANSFDSDELLPDFEDEGVSFTEDSMKRVDFIACLPFELAVYILFFADVPSLCRAKTVSKAWLAICSGALAPARLRPSSSNSVLSTDGLVWRDFFYRNKGWKIRPDVLQAASESLDMNTAEMDALARRDSSPPKLSPNPGHFSPKSSTSHHEAFDWATSSTPPTMSTRLGITKRLSTLVADLSGTFSRASVQSNSSRGSSAPFQSTRSRSRYDFYNQPKQRRAPYLSANGPIHSPFHSNNSAALKLAPPRGLDWGELYKNRYLLEQRWLHGHQQTMVLRGHSDSVYCIQADRYKVVSGSVSSLHNPFFRVSFLNSAMQQLGPLTPNML